MDLEEKIKNGIKDLWEKTFHLSKTYIDLIFENYFVSEYVAYEMSEGRIVAALMGIPYEFGYGKNKLKGLYLLGLATEERWRHKGLMSKLLEEINSRISEDFDFSFLIPASDLNADYYRRRGYFNSFFRLEERFTSIHDFKNDFIISLADANEKIKELKLALFSSLKITRFSDSGERDRESIIKFIESREKKPGASTSLIHSEKDLNVVLDNGLMNDGIVFYSEDEDSNLTGVAFVEKEDVMNTKRIKLPAIYVEDKSTYYSLLNYIKKDFQDYSMSVLVNSDHYSTPAIIDEVYGAQNPQGNDLETLFGLLETQFDITKLMQPYGMVRLLNVRRILQYIASLHKDVEFKLHIKGNPQEEKNLYIVRNGKLLIENYNPDKVDKSILNLSMKEFSEILLRKKDSNSLIMEAFGIPRLVLEMKLLLRS